MSSRRARGGRVRRGNGEGSVFQIADGTWRGFITLGYDRQGRQIKKWRRGRSRRDVADKLNCIAAEAGTRLVSRPEAVTVDEWLTRFMELRGKEVRPTTRQNYRHYFNKISPAIGSLQLAKVTPLTLRQFYATLGDMGLSPSVRQHIHHFLAGAFRDAMRMELIDRSPVNAVDAPKGGRNRLPAVWSSAEVSAFLETAQGDRLYGAYYLLLAAGFRVGEVLGLQWQDVTGDAIHVTRTLSVVNNRPLLGPPKTGRGYRTVYLDEETLEVLGQRRSDWELERGACKRWMESGLIFSTSLGTPTHPHNLRRSFRRICEAARVPQIRVHDLRHTYITLARDRGLDAEVIADRVGQDVRVTMRIYSNVTEARKLRAALPLKELLRDGR